jgi:hypothetical protein
MTHFQKTIFFHAFVSDREPFFQGPPGKAFLVLSNTVPSGFHQHGIKLYIFLLLLTFSVGPFSRRERGGGGPRVTGIRTGEPPYEILYCRIKI